MILAISCHGMAANWRYGADPLADAYTHTNTRPNRELLRAAEHCISNLTDMA
ncbi:hypothetical protein PXNS11_310375 [Stutzerimonas xanthomarina]|nr:hypothetical protein PXNS11_310375 [Stutzerimonas xanthomarina]